MLGRAAFAGAAMVAILAASTAVAPSVLISNITYVLGAFTGAALCSLGAARQPVADRRAWHWLTITQLAWGLANLVWLWFESVQQVTVPVPSIFDALYLSAQLLLLASVGMLLRPTFRTTSPTRLIVDALLVASSVFFVAWSTLLDDLPGLDGSAQAAITWAYPLADVAVVVIAALALSRVPRGERLRWLLLGGGVVVLAGCDSFWAYMNLKGGFASGSGIVDATWSSGYLLIGLAALAPATGLERGGLIRERWTAFVPYVPFGFVVLIAAFSPSEGDDPVSTVAGFLAAGLLLTRQVLAVLENQRLARDLERRVEERTVELATSEALFRAVTHMISDAVVVLDADRKVQYASPGVSRIAGYEPGELMVDRLLSLVHPDDLAEVAALSDRVSARPGESAMMRCRVRRVDGSWGYAEITMANMHEHAAIRGHLLAIRDVSEQRDLEDRLRHRAEHDDLTGLVNRASLVEAARQAFASGERPSMILLDLDGFKEINDTLGHSIGDLLLVEVASRLRRAIGDHDDVVARLGGDEFAVLVRGRGAAATSVADRLLRCLQRPFEVDGRTLRCRASIGVTTSGDAPEELLRNADLAMYVAKERGKDSIQVFHAGMHRRMVRRMHLEHELNGAAERDELTLVYQPVVEVDTGEVVGAEALLRWHAAEGEIAPLEFIPIAEETGLIGPIGRWVLMRACRDAVSWPVAAGRVARGIAVNASVRQLVEHDLVGDVEAALETSGLEPSRLTIELTESAVMDHSDKVLARLRSLKHLGVRLSIDDFGTGYSSLGRLRFLPVDEVKIDRAFLSQPGGDDENHMPVVEAVLALAESLGLEVVAEGVERVEQLWALRERRCRRAQGYLLGRPAPLAEFERRLGEPLEVGNMTLNFSA